MYIELDKNSTIPRSRIDFYLVEELMEQRMEEEVVVR